MPIIRDIIYGAVAHGARLSSMCEELDIDPSDLSDSEKHMPFESACLAWNIAVRQTKDPLLGLHLGERATPAILGLVGYLMHNSPSLLESFRQVSKYARVATNMLDYRMSVTRSEVTLEYVPATLWLRSDPASAMQAVDQAMAGTLNVFHLLSGVRIYPVGTEFTRSRSRFRTEYERVFQGIPRFDRKLNRLTFTRRQLDAPVVSHDRSLFLVFERLIRKKQARSAPRTTRDRVVNIIMSEFQGQLPPIDAVAAHLSLTTRSLQRNLKAEGTSFREIIASIGAGMAKILLKTSDTTVKEVASMLGYSGARAFRQAYRSWTNTTPRR